MKTLNVGLDAPDAYGTLVELGYAIARDKPVVFNFCGTDGPIPVGDLWFAEYAATRRRPDFIVERAVRRLFPVDGRAEWTDL